MEPLVPISALVVPAFRLPRSIAGFTYCVPAGLAPRVRVGSLVRVRFRSSEVVGVVWTLTPPPEPKPTRPILDVLGTTIASPHLRFLASLAVSHLASPSAFLRLPQHQQPDRSRGTGTRFLHYLGNPASHAKDLEALSGEQRSLVLASGVEAEVLPERGERWVRGSDSALLDPAGFERATVVYREESSSHRRREPPYLDARSVAAIRAECFGRPYIATAQCPRAETVRWVLEGTVHPLNAPPPLPPLEITVVTGKPFSDSSTIDALRATVDGGTSAFVWVPSKGFAGSFVCRDCGFAVRCPRCGVALGQPSPGRLICGTCGTAMAIPARCPRCGSVHVGERARGLGGVLAELSRLLPGIPLRALSAGEPLPPAPFRGILVGTYARIASLPRYAVSTAAVYALERHLNIPDFLADERFAQRLTALRFALPSPGRLLLLAQDATLAASWRLDPRTRIAELLPERRATLHPPFVRFVRLGTADPSVYERFLHQPGIRRADQLPGRTPGVLLRVDPAAWSELAPLFTGLPRTVTVEPDWEWSEG